MLLNLLKEAVHESRYSDTKKQTLRTLEETVGKEKARRIVESYKVGPEDYSKWLDVIIGYGRDEGINIKTKAAFQDVAYAVLENDPAPIDQDLQDAVVNTLWANFKAQQQHSKVEKVTRAKEEEEQLNYALKKMKGGGEEEEYDDATGTIVRRQGTYKERWHPNSLKNRMAIATQKQRTQNSHNKPLLHRLKYQEDEQESIFAQMFKQSQGMEDEEFDDEYFDQADFDNENELVDDEEAPDEFDPRDFDDDEGDRDFGEDGDLDQDLEFGDEDYDEDADIMRRGEEQQHGRDLEDYDEASDEGIDQDINIMRQAKSHPKAYYAAENEEQEQYSSPFSKGQLVTCKKDKSTHKVEIPDGPGDQVGILVDGRIKMVPSKDLESIRPNEEEESTSNPTKISFLHDVLTGENSRDNLSKLQKQIEDEAANCYMTHHAKFAKNPHTKGSIAYKAWEKGVASAGKELWAPKKVEITTKPKPKPKKR